MPQESIGIKHYDFKPGCLHIQETTWLATVDMQMPCPILVDPALQPLVLSTQVQFDHLPHKMQRQNAGNLKAFRETAKYMYVCMYVCIYIYMYTYWSGVYMFIYIYGCIYIYMYTYWSGVYMFIYIYGFIYIYI